jgi:aerobic-type carbon monoxide dehydrogenase small subunit (CoxS/CutS family)
MEGMGMDQTGKDAPTVDGGSDPPPSPPDTRTRRVAIGAGAAAAAVAVAGAAAAVADRAGLFNRGLTIKVNGQDHQVQADPATPLLYVLRNEVGLRDARFGCGMAECGACTVQLDGKPIRSCVTPVSTAAGKAVTTPEGLGTAARPHPLQRAFIDQQAAQCGYCIPGMIVEAEAFLRATPRPTDAQIKTALNGHLCRCGTHYRIVRAVKAAAGV